MGRIGTVTVAALGGLLGLLPAASGQVSAQGLLVWLALVAAALGSLCGGVCRGGGARWAPLLAFPVAPAVWATALFLGWGGRLPQPHWAALAAAGLFGLGYAAGRLTRRPVETSAGLVLVSLVLVGAPLGGGLGGPPIAARDPALAVRLFEFSPATWLVESAGVDWMRRAPVYHSAGTDWFPPERRAVRGFLAGPLLFLVGCAAAATAALVRRDGPSDATPTS